MVVLEESTFKGKDSEETIWGYMKKVDLAMPM